MAVDQLKTDNNASKSGPRPGTRFPTYDLATCVEVPRIIHTMGGGQLSPEQLAAHLGYKGTNNGSYLSKVASTRYFGLIDRSGPVFVPTTLAHQIHSPVYPQDAAKALVDAFLSVELFKKVYEEYRGRELPPEFGMLNALRNQFGVSADRVKDAYRTMMDSADTAGFFTTRAGARTHLIMPTVGPAPVAYGGGQTVNTPTAEELGFGGGGANGGGSGGSLLPVALPSQMPQAQGPKPFAVSDVKAKYLSALIELFEKKSQEGDVDEKLMERIERLLGEASAGGAP